MKRSAPNYALAGDELDAAVHRETGAFFSGFRPHPAGASVFDPGDDQRIPKTGAWITITRPLPSIEGGIDKHVTVGRVFWAQHDSNADDAGFAPDGRYKVKLTTEWGDVWLWPYEYRALSTENIVAGWQRGDFIFHPRNVSIAQFDTVAYYARSRGISLSSAAVMALGTVDGNIGWFEPEAELADELLAIAEFQ